VEVTAGVEEIRRVAGHGMHKWLGCLQYTLNHLLHSFISPSTPLFNASAVPIKPPLPSIFSLFSRIRIGGPGVRRESELRSRVGGGERGEGEERGASGHGCGPLGKELELLPAHAAWTRREAESSNRRWCTSGA
jgi:hypothetical protein